MPKRGDIREDGKVFLQSNKKCIGGEHWITMDHFLRVMGSDYYEKTQAYKDYIEDLRKTKPERVAQKREKNKEKSRVYQAKRRAENPEMQKEADKRYYEKHKNNPDFIKRCKEASMRHYIKKHPNWRPKEERLREALKRKQQKKELVAAKKEANEAAKALKLSTLAEKPKRKALTEEERKEAKRQGKRNYKHVRRARINNCEVKATPKIVGEARKNAGERCYYCGKKSELTLDHFEPLAKGGAHCVSNFVFACFSCNSRKRDLDPFDFMASNVADSF